MSDLISRQAAIDALNKMKIYRPLDSDRYVISDCLNKIVNLPSAEPEIIRCKDCKHYNAGFECLIEGYGIERDKNWYCGDAERRTDE